MPCRRHTRLACVWSKIPASFSQCALDCKHAVCACRPVLEANERRAGLEPGLQKEALYKAREQRLSELALSTAAAHPPNAGTGSVVSAAVAEAAEQPAEEPADAAAPLPGKVDLGGQQQTVAEAVAESEARAANLLQEVEQLKAQLELVQQQAAATKTQAAADVAALREEAKTCKATHESELQQAVAAKDEAAGALQQQLAVAQQQSIAMLRQERDAAVALAADAQHTADSMRAARDVARRGERAAERDRDEVQRMLMPQIVGAQIVRRRRVRDQEAASAVVNSLLDSQ